MYFFMKSLPTLSRFGWMLLFVCFWTAQSFAQFIAPASPVCSGAAQFYQVISHPNSTYSWTISTGGTLSGNIGTGNTVFWGGPGTRTLTVIEHLFGGANSTYTATVVVGAIPTPVILPDFAPDCPPEDKGHEDPQNIIFIPPNDDPCPKACEFMTIVYSTPLHAGNTYEWFVGGGTPAYATGNSVSVTWGAAGTGSITVIEKTPAGCIGTASTCIEIIPSPKASGTGNGQDLTLGAIYICAGQSVTFHDNSTGGSSWFWDFGDGVTSTDQHPVHEYPNQGTYSCKFVVKNACGCENIIYFEVVVKEGIVPSLGCISTVCIGATDLYNLYWPGMENCPGANIIWTIHGGSITNNPSNTSVMVKWDDNDGFITQNGVGAIEVIIDGCDGVCVYPLWVEVPVIHQTHISGIQNACVGEVFTYSIPYQPGISVGNYGSGVDFAWSITPSGGVFVNPIPHSNSVEIRWNTPGTYTIKIDSYSNDLLDGECKFIPEALTVTVLPNLEVLPPVSIICSGETPPNWTAMVAGSPFTAAGPIDWTLEDMSGGVLFSQNSNFSFTFPAGMAPAGNYLIHAQSPDYCAGGGYASLKVVAAQTTTGTISGENQVCLNTPYNYTTNAIPPAGTVLEWSADYGAVGQIYGAQTSVSWGNSGPRKLYLWLSGLSAPHCKSLIATFIVNEYMPNPVISGSITPCVNELKTYSVTGLSHYTELRWSVVTPNSGSVAANQGTASVDIQYLNQSGAAIIRLEALVCGSWITVNYPVNVTPVPTISLDPTGSACRDELVTFNVTTTGIASVNWNFGDLGTGTGTPVTHAYNQIGSYPVTATVHYLAAVCGGITQQVAGSIDVNPLPVGNLTYPNGNKICPPNYPASVMLVASVVGPVGGYSFAWSAGATPTGTPGEATVSAAGTYFVTISDNTTGCETVLTALVNGCGNCTSTCDPLDPPLTFTKTVPACNTVSFTRTTGPATFSQWTFGDNTLSLSTATTVSHTYAHSGYYWVNLYSTSPNQSPPPPTCNMRVQDQVVIHLVPDFIWHFSCGTGGLQTELIDLSDYLPGEPPTSWTWTYPGGSSNLAHPTIPLAVGSNSVTLTVSNGFATCTIMKTVVVPPLPTPMITVTGGQCEDTPFTFSASVPFGSTVVNWAWNFDGTSGSSLQLVKKTFNVLPALHTISLVVTDEWGCTSSASTTVNVFDHSPNPPVVTAPNPPIICQPGFVNLNVNTAGMTSPFTYGWFNATNIGLTIGTNSAYTAYTSGLFGINVTDGHGCKYVSMANQAVQIVPSPSAYFFSDPPHDLKSDYCKGDQIYVSVFAGNSAGGYSYNWSIATPNGTFASSNQEAQINSNSGGVGVYNFTVTVTDLASGCTNIGTFSCTVHALPLVSINASGNCPPVTLTASAAGAIFYNWSTGDTGSSMVAGTGGQYRVTATDAFGCTDEDLQQVEYVPNLGNLMVGCYEFCGAVKWQAPLCAGCHYEWSNQNGFVANGPIGPFLQSGVYHLLVTSPAGCTAYSDDIEINITNPEVCHECKFEGFKPTIKCIGNDPISGVPLYEFTFDYINHGGTVAGLVTTMTLGSGYATIINPPTGTINGGGSTGTVTGYIISSDPSVCIEIKGFIDIGNGDVKECVIWQQCYDLPAPCGEGCTCESLKFEIGEAACVNGYFHVNGYVKSEGCGFKVLGAIVKTPSGGIYTMSNLNTNYSNNFANFDGWIFGAGTGIYCFTVFVQMSDGQICKLEYCRQLYQECGEIGPCNVTKVESIECLEMGPLGRHYRVHFAFYANVPNCDIVVISKAGLIGNLSYFYVGGNYFGAIDYYSLGQPITEACFQVVLICDNVPKCEDYFCIKIPEECQGGKMEGKLSQKNDQNTVESQQTDDFFAEDRSVKTVENSQPIIAPNPASESVEARFAAPKSENAQLNLLDLNGKLVLTQPIGANQRTANFSVKNLPSGVYILQLKNDSGAFWREKLIIIH
jgi:PKD repeat protein